MTFTINYTTRSQPDSSAVDRAWYDANTKDLYLELHGCVYLYAGVPWYTYQGLEDAESAGKFYANTIKPHYGPARRLGPVTELVQNKVVEQARPAVLTPTVETVHPTQRPEVQVGGLTVRSDGSGEFKGRLPLNKEAQTPTGKVAYAHTIYFTLTDSLGTSPEKSHTVQASNMDDAIESVLDLAELLGADVEVKGVLVRFE